MNTTTTATSKLGIAIDLDHLGDLMQQYVQSLAPRDRLETRLRLSTFLVWAKKQRESEASAANLLTFKVEKGAGNGTT
jgi:hypothetical protein